MAVGRSPSSEQPRRPGVAGLLGEVAGLDPAPAGQPVAGHGGPVAGGTLVGDLAAGAAEMGDPLVSPRDQVVDDQPGPGGVVAADHVGPDQALPARAGDDHRHVADGGGQAAVVGQRPDHHQPLDLEGAQRLHRPQVQARPLAGPRPGHDRAGQEGVEAGLVQHRPQGIDDLDEPGVVQVGDQHPDGARAQGRQRPGRPVGPVAELPGRLLDPQAAGLGDPGVAPHGQRHQRLGHAGAGGHVDDGRPAPGRAGDGRASSSSMPVSPAGPRSCRPRRGPSASCRRRRSARPPPPPRPPTGRRRPSSSGARRRRRRPGTSWPR